MAADATAYDAVLKEVWTGDKIEEQLYQGNPLLEMIESAEPVTQVGDKALVPVHVGRSGGYSAVPRAGTDSLNPADAQELAQAQYNYTHHWFQIKIESSTVDETSSKPLAVASVVDTEVTGAIDDTRRQLSRQMFSNGDALIAACDTTSSSTTVELLASGLGKDAIARGWLYAGLPVDIGSASNEGSVATDRVIQSVTESQSDPDMVISGAAVSTTTATDFVSIANNRSGTTSYETNGLRNLFGSTSSVVGTLDPATYPQWKPASVDSSTTTLTLPLIYGLQRAVFQKIGKEPDTAITSAKQYEAVYKLLQAQVRFNGDGNLGAGNLEGLNIGGTKLQRQVDCLDRDFFLFTKKDLFVVKNDKPAWASQKYGGQSGVLEWVQGGTRLTGAAVYRIQLAVKRRNSSASAVALTD